jgi:hypothetical protein
MYLIKKERQLVWGLRANQKWGSIQKLALLRPHTDRHYFLKLQE